MEHQDTEATGIASASGHFSVESAGERFTAENVVLANGAFQRTRIPSASAGLPGHVHQLHSHEYQVPDGAVWWAPGSPAARAPSTGSCRSTCTAPPYGINALQMEQLPSPRPLHVHPLVSGKDGSHGIHLRDLGRCGVRLHGRFGGTDEGVLAFSDDLPGRPETMEVGFGPRLERLASLTTPC